MATTANGLVTPALSDANNPPADFLALAASIDGAYGKHVADVASLPATGAFVGQTVWVDDIDSPAYWDDTAATWNGFYKSYTPTVAGSTSPTIAASYCVMGEEVTVKFLLTLTAAVTTTLTMDLPLAPHASVTTTQSIGDVMMRDTSAGGANRVFGNVAISSGSTVLFYYNATAATTSFVTTGANPWTWATTDTLGGTIRYRRA